MNEMINASTVLFSLLTIHEKNSLYLNASIFLFSIVGCANHILPENLNGLTHLVKMLFSNVLFALVNVNPIYGIILSLVDLTPMFSKNKTIKKIGEILLQLPRLGIEIYLYKGLFETHFNDVLIMLVCKIIYFFERRARIKKGIRNDYGSWHSAEHMGLYILFKDLTDIPFEFKSYLIIFVFFVISVWIFFHVLNVHLNNNCIIRAPEWVTESTHLKSILQDKTEKNRRSMKWHNYIIKPWTSHLKLEFVSWEAIERICDSILLNVDREKYDLVIGVVTGGSFVGKYISHKLKLPFTTVHSKLWSEISFQQNFKQTCYFVLGYDQMPKIGKIPDVNGKRILLVDDTTFTGITMLGNKKVLLEEGKALSVDTLVMWMKGPHKPDFYYSNKRIPILWEWGVEVD